MKLTLSPDELRIVARALSMDLSLSYSEHDHLVNENEHAMASARWDEIETAERLLRRIEPKIAAERENS